MRKKFLITSIGIMIASFFLSTFQSVAYSSERIINDDIEYEQFLDDETFDESYLLGPEWYHKPSSYAELVDWYQTLEGFYPEYLEVFKANELYGTGQSAGGYDLYYVRITNESLGLHKPEVLFLGSPHGDETVGTIGLYWFSDWLMRMAFTDESCEEYDKEWLQWLIDNREIYFEVAHNPYGFDYELRYDIHGWDLNREADYDGPGSPTGGIWASIPGQTLRAFVDSHLIRSGCDFHGGARMLLYPWADTHSDVTGVSPISGTSYGHAPPDFYFFDAGSLRLGNYMGDYGGDLDEGNIGTIYEIIWYSVKGGLTPWAYGADVVTNPVEDPYVKDETFGNYPGSGIFWVTPEMSTTKNPSESTFGNDTIHRYGAEVRRYVLYQTDIAQPYVYWHKSSVKNNTEVLTNTELLFFWQVNGSLVVDHTSMQWGTDPDPIHHPQYGSDDHDEYEGEYLGGTGWDDAENGNTNGVTYEESFVINEPGEYYFVAKAQVDQVYENILRPDVYGDTSYLRLVKERTNDEYYEMLNGVDGVEEIYGQTWWYSPIIHVTILPENDCPEQPEVPEGAVRGEPGKTYLYSSKTIDPDDNKVYYLWDWGDGTFSEWIGPFSSGVTTTASHVWEEKGTYSIRVKAKDIYDAESEWSDPLKVRIPRSKIISSSFFTFFEQNFPRFTSLLQVIFRTPN
jgi:hypothetical protein